MPIDNIVETCHTSFAYNNNNKGGFLYSAFLCITHALSILHIITTAGLCHSLNEIKANDITVLQAHPFIC